MHNLRWVAFALLIGMGPALVLAHGLLGTGPAVSAVFIVGIIMCLAVTARSVDGLRLNLADEAFILFVVAAAASTWGNGLTASMREYALFGLTLACYPVGRLFSEQTPSRTFVWILAALLLAGSAATLIALIDQFNYPHGKPLVFGEFDAAPAQFLQLAAFIVFAILVVPMKTWERNCLLGICAACAVLFAASQVRFTFAAFGIVMLIAVQGRWRYRVAAALVLVVVLGLLLRPATSMVFVGHLFAPADCSALVSSISMRKQLFSDAISLLPTVGMFGFGLDGFIAKTCVGVEVHNSFLQAAIEFGWVGGLAFAAVVLPAMRARAQFAFCGLIFELALSAVHGRLSSDFLLLFFAGYAVRELPDAKRLSFHAASDTLSRGANPLA